MENIPGSGRNSPATMSDVLRRDLGVKRIFDPHPTALSGLASTRSAGRGCIVAISPASSADALFLSRRRRPGGSAILRAIGEFQQTLVVEAVRSSPDQRSVAGDEIPHRARISIPTRWSSARQRLRAHFSADNPRQHRGVRSSRMRCLDKLAAQPVMRSSSAQAGT